MIRRLTSLLIGLGMVLSSTPVAIIAQTSQSTEQQKIDAALQKKAFDLLEQVISGAQALKLPENRLRVQWQAGDLLWERDEGRARTMFSQAAAGIGEVIRSLDPADRRYTELLQAPSQLRQEMINTVARRDPRLAYDFLLATRPPAPQNPTSNTPPANTGQQNAETTLEMNLLAQIAASDPALALQNAEAALDKGQFPGSLSRMLAQLQKKDRSAAKKLEDKLLKRLSPETLLSNSSATSLSLSLLRPGPWLPETQASSAQAGSSGSNQPTNQALDEAAFRALLEVVIAASLSATPRTTGQGVGVPGGMNIVPAAPAAPVAVAAQGVASATADARREQAMAQTMQNNARNLANGLQSLLPQIDKYLPARLQVARQKLTEMGIKPNPISMDRELSTLMQQGSADDILQAASRASTPELQSMLYRQAASKAMNEGNLDRARQIANQYLDERQREGVFRELERQKTLHSALAGKMDEARQTLATLKTESERVTWLTQVASLAMKKNDQKLATQFLDEARNMVSRRVENYPHFDLQMRVARAYVNVDSARTFDMLSSGIERLNELLSAAAMLSGFELRVFKEDELLMQGGTQLNSMVTRYGQELAGLARRDFERAQLAADRFQRNESRLMAHLAIVRGLLGSRNEGEPMMSMPPPPPPPPPAPVIRGEGEIPRSSVIP